QGLTSNTCYNLFLDNNHELWASLDKGISKIEYPSALSYFNYTNGLDGVVYCMIEHGNVIYAGTTSGLYYLDKKNQFKNMSISTGVWDLKEIDGEIWVTSSSGIYTIDHTSVKLIKDFSSYTLALSSNKQRIWIGLDEGLGIFEKKDNNWIWQGKVNGINHEVRSIAEESDSVLWGSYHQISRLVFDNQQSKIIQIQTISKENDFTENFYITESFKFRDKTLFGTKIGVFTFDLASNKFVSNSTFGDRFTDLKHEARALAEDADHNVWLSSNRTIGKLIFENEQVQSWDTLAFARLKSTDVWRIVPANNGIVYFCTTDGLFRYDPHVIKKYDNDYYTLINKVEINRDSVISYLEIDNTDIEESPIPFVFNDVRFNYAATSYNSDEKILFSYVLDGFDEKWSSWITESIKEYTNLPHGDYTFRVKAKNLYGVESKIAKYRFSISPPWYRTYWAYLILFLLFVAFIFVLGRIQRKRLLKRQQAKIKIQQKKLEQEREISNKLRRIDKLKDEFLANTSHELRTPLNGIIGISESLYEECQHIDEQDAKNNIAMVIASGKRLASMVDSILDYSKLKTEKLEIRKKPVDLKSLASIVIEMSRPLVSKNDLSLINNIPDDLPLLEADENRLQQILYNLIGNAIKFTPKGTISISATSNGESAEIEVRDEGVGIPEDKLERIFDSYEQVNVEEDRDYIGTGLGLTITKKLVELHNGSIRVESKLGVGSSFKFTIPISMQESSTWIETPYVHMEETRLTEAFNSSGNTQFNILIVDDEQINRQVLVNHLKHEPYNLQLASNGKEALEAMEQNHFDLVLLDVMMPKMS
ncbi:MAG: response regulator, partial [Cyclobacteriaceae bacterium]|nr:response regulator [Cyclobacteriaceae bacterium]